MNYSILAISVVITVLLPLAAYFIGLKSGFKASDEDAAKLREESANLESKLIETLSNVDSFASKAQVKFLEEQRESFTLSLKEQRENLEALIEKVDKLRAEVRNRESEQQELRGLKQEDEAAITQALARYTEFSTESISLEQKLAESLRTLDAMASEIVITPDQQAVFAELSNALTQASAQLRDVIIDYQNANERLINLKSRFTDLENEYSKLIDQQLGG